jgi:hypothetical protein
VVVAGLLALASALAVGYAPVATAGKEGSPRHPSLRNDETMRAEAVENLERQAAKLALRDGSSCPHDFSSLDTGRALRVSLFYGYDEHEGRVHDRVHARAMLEILTKECRGRLSACDFSVVSRSASAASLARTIGGRRVEVDLFTTSLPEGVDESTSYVSALFEQDRLSRSVKERFFRELVESDVVFYMGHSRLGGGMGFDDQTGATTLVNAFFRRPLVPVLEALRQRPTNLKILGLFSCESERYFRRGFQAANPALSLILTTGDIRYGPAEQTSLGALEAILSRYCGYAFHDSMISANEPDRNMTWLIRGR